jgi:hypothetical protein
MVFPVIINVDSQFDWTKEVNVIWESLPWNDIKNKLAPSIAAKDWNFRKNQQLVIIGLCSPSTIDNEYFQRCNTNNYKNEEESRNNKREEEFWKNRQTGDSSRNVCPGLRFTGEEPFLRSPASCDKGIFEAYGFYTHNCFDVLEGKVDVDKLPLGVRGGAGIFLCPERIIDIYPKLMGLSSTLQRAIHLSDNPSLINLEMVLLHELGHHFFPVHRAGVGRYISEAFANLFCASGVKKSVLPWLLYKTWHLQPPEYSAYRPLSLLTQGGAKVTLAIESAFSGSIKGWEELLVPEHGMSKRWEEILRTDEYTTMTQALDYIPALGLIRNLSTHLNVNWDNSFQGGHLHMSASRMQSKKIPADLLFDLYESNSIYPWVLTPNIPEEFWSSWGMSTSHNNLGMDSAPPEKLSWPEGPLFRATGKDDWERISKESPYAWARKAVGFWLTKA